MQHVDLAVADLEQVLTSAPRLQQPWRHLVRQRLATLIEALADERTTDEEGWLVARETHLCRERAHLVMRLRVLNSSMAEDADPEPVRRGLQRVLRDVVHHRQRVNDLFYDTVAMEVGGSE